MWIDEDPKRRNKVNLEKKRCGAPKWNKHYDSRAKKTGKSVQYVAKLDNTQSYAGQN